MRISLIWVGKKKTLHKSLFIPVHFINSSSNIVSERLFFKCNLLSNKSLMVTFLVIITTKLNITSIHSLLLDTQHGVKVGMYHILLRFPFISSQSSCNLIFIASFLTVWQFLNGLPPKELKYTQRSEKEGKSCYHGLTDGFCSEELHLPLLSLASSTLNISDWIFQWVQIVKKSQFGSWTI